MQSTCCDVLWEKVGQQLCCVADETELRRKLILLLRCVVALRGEYYTKIVLLQSNSSIKCTQV